jgi:ribosome maturation factor RimP
LVTPVAERAGFDVDDVSVTPAGRRQVVRVTVDADGGVSLDAVAELSRALSAALDGSDVMGERSYTLEVGSRGATAPLTRPRHWLRNIGRLVKVSFADAGRPALTGRITAADEAAARVQADSASGAAADSAEPLRIDYTEVRRATVQIEFTKPAKDRPAANRSTRAGASGRQRGLAADGDTDSADATGTAGPTVRDAGAEDEDEDEGV